MPNTTRRIPLSRRIARRTTIFRVTVAIVSIIFATMIAIIILAHTAQPTWPQTVSPTTPVFEQQAATTDCTKTPYDASCAQPQLDPTGGACGDANPEILASAAISDLPRFGTTQTRCLVLPQVWNNAAPGLLINFCTTHMGIVDESTDAPTINCTTGHNDLASEDTTDDVPPANAAKLAAECHGRHGMIIPDWNPQVRINCDQPTKP